MLKVICSGLIAGILCTACVWPQPRPLTTAEDNAWIVRNQCRQGASNLFGQWGWNPDWQEYYDMCLRSFGF